MKLVLINVGISGGHRGIVFPNLSFVYVPLNNISWKCKKIPHYERMRVDAYSKSNHRHHWKTLADLLPSLRGKQAHDDPDFQNMTYGHARRGFGYEMLLRAMDEDDILLFYATLDYREIDDQKRDSLINPEWGAYIIGAFSIENIFESEEFEELPKREKLRFKNNPHYYCDAGAHLWIAGKRGERGLFSSAVPLSSPKDSMTCVSFLRRNFETAGGKAAGSHGWYRAALTCDRNASKVWREISSRAY